MNRVIKNDVEYKEMLAALAQLLEKDPALGTREDEELELLTLLVQDYESRKYEFIPPDPIEAIKFRMEQQGLTPKDLIPYLGSRSKVSEVMSEKRALTKTMIRALQSGLRIPASILIKENPKQDLSSSRVETIAGLVKEDRVSYTTTEHHTQRIKRKSDNKQSDNLNEWEVRYAVIEAENKQLKRKIGELEKRINILEEGKNKTE